MGFWRCTTKTSTMSERKTADKASLRGIYVNWISCSFVAIQCFALIDPIQPRCKSNRSKRKNFNNTNTRKNHKSSWNVYACKQSSFTRYGFNCKLCDFFSRSLNEWFICIWSNPDVLLQSWQKHIAKKMSQQKEMACFRRSPLYALSFHVFCIVGHFSLFCF